MFQDSKRKQTATQTQHWQAWQAQALAAAVAELRTLQALPAFLKLLLLAQQNHKLLCFQVSARMLSAPQAPLSAYHPYCTLRHVPLQVHLQSTAKQCHRQHMPSNVTTAVAAPPGSLIISNTAAFAAGPAAPAPPTYTYITPTAAGPNLSNNAAALSAPDQLTLQLPMGADSAPAAVTVAHRPDVWAPGVWVGELQVSPGPLSVVTLKMSAAGDILTGDAIYWDAQQSKMRSVMVRALDGPVCHLHKQHMGGNWGIISTQHQSVGCNQHCISHVPACVCLTLLV